MTATQRTVSVSGHTHANSYESVVGIGGRGCVGPRRETVHSAPVTEGSGVCRACRGHRVDERVARAYSAASSEEPEARANQSASPCCLAGDLKVSILALL